MAKPLPSDEAEFTGFPNATFSFLEGIAAHNEKPWFDANRDLYEAGYVAPAKAFVAVLGPQLRTISKAVQFEPKLNGSLGRINRDIRFSKDKRPYKDHLDVWFWHGDKKSWSAPGFWFSLGPLQVRLGRARPGGALLSAPTRSSSCRCSRRMPPICSRTRVATHIALEPCARPQARGSAADRSCRVAGAVDRAQSLPAHCRCPPLGDRSGVLRGAQMSNAAVDRSGDFAARRHPALLFRLFGPDPRRCRRPRRGDRKSRLQRQGHGARP